MIREHSLLWACVLAALACVALGAGTAATGATAAAAASAFEAAPFLFFARALTPLLGARLAALATLGGCGCTRGAIPGALALPAIALCALTFGPVPTLARTLFALGLIGLTRRGAGDRHGGEADLFADLERIGASAFLASLAATALARSAPAIPAPLGFAAGLGLGVLAPCATAGIAIAAAFSHGAPAIAGGILCATGLWSKSAVTPHGGAAPRRDARIAAAILACALGCIALRGPSGLVSPRLLVPIGAAAAIALASLPRAKSRSRANALVPLLMLGSLVAVPRPPNDRADATRLDDAFPGERLSFIGVASLGRGAHSTLTRYAITCCRLDATPVSVRLDRGLGAASDGRWIAATGTLTTTRDGELELRPQQLRAIAPPADPYIYR